MYSRTIASLLGMCVGKLAMANSTQARWFIDSRNGSGKALSAFARQALPMVWDFAEPNPFAGSADAWTVQLEVLIGGLLALPIESAQAMVVQADARVAGAVVPPGSALVATDPPYFAQIAYADLADYFYIWERRALRRVHPDLFATIATPKDPELVPSPSLPVLLDTE